MVAAMLLHEHTLRLVYRARSSAASLMTSVIVRKATTNSIVTTSILPIQSSVRKKSAPLSDVKEIVFDDFEWSEGAR
jgi:hypothetical protein